MERHEESVVIERTTQHKMLFHKFVNNESAVSREIEEW